MSDTPQEYEKSPNSNLESYNGTWNTAVTSAGIIGSFLLGLFFSMKITVSVTGMWFSTIFLMILFMILFFMFIAPLIKHKD